MSLPPLPPLLLHLLQLLALAGGTRWADLAWPLLDEMLDRGVLWACREHPELAATGERWEADGCTDERTDGGPDGDAHWGADDSAHWGADGGPDSNAIWWSDGGS